MKYSIKCKNCEYFKMGIIKNFGYCDNEMREVYFDMISPKSTTRMLIRIPHDCTGIVFHVHKDFGCIEGLVKEKIDRRRGKIR